MNAVTVFLNPNSKIVSIEDTPELQVPHPNWIREVIRGKPVDESGASVTMFDLLRAALRQRPDEIIIGEIRGEEGAIMFQAMQTGHSCMATFHASSVEKLIQRLTGNPINIPKTYIDNLNLVVIQSSVRLPNGKEGRRIISMNEIVGYDSSSDSFSFIEVFRWNPANDTFEFTGYMNSYLLEEVIAAKRGIPPHRKRDIYAELTRRANILRKLKEQGVTGFDELYKVISKAYKEGVFR
jgi:flagellar protein FlaI